MQSLKDLWRGIVRHPWKAITYSFTAFSVLFTLIKAVNQFLPGISIEGPVALTIVIVTSALWGLGKVWKPSKIKIKVANSPTVIEVLFGDLFAQEGVRAIAVNEFFDSEVGGKLVAEKSLHGIFISKCYGSHPEPFDKQVEQQLKEVKCQIVDRPSGKTKRYDIGTSAMLKAEKDEYLVFALTHTDPETAVASADVTMMWIALHHLWERARIECNGFALNLPLVGSGLAKIGLPTRDLLNLIILSAITVTKEQQVTHLIRIVLHRDRFEDLDLRDVQSHWKE